MSCDLTGIGIFEALVTRLRQDFPHLTILPYLDAPVERAYYLPVQPGLVAEVGLNLQNDDELHLNIGPHFWCEWFPCHREDVVDEYRDAVEGFLDGRYRVVDHFKGRKCYKSELQGTGNGRWQSVATSRHLAGWSLPWAPKRQVITRNRESEPQG